MISDEECFERAIEAAQSHRRERSEQAGKSLRQSQHFIQISEEPDAQFYPVYRVIAEMKGLGLTAPSESQQHLRHNLQKLLNFGWVEITQSHSQFSNIFMRYTADCQILAGASPGKSEGTRPETGKTFWVRSESSLAVTTPEDLPETPSGNEGAARQITRNIFERNPTLRRACIAHYTAKDGRLACQACDMDFASIYGGDIGAGFIHIHHLDPLGNAAQRETDPLRDLVPLCPNCHAMVHKTDPPLTPAALRKRMEHS